MDRLIEKFNDNKYIIILTVLSALLNFWHINFSAIQPIYPDETFFDLYAFKIIDFIRGNGINYSLDPPIYPTILAIAFGIYYIFGLFVGLFDNINDFLIHFGTNREAFIIIGRSVSALFGVLTIPFSYKVASKLFGKKAALIGVSGLVICYPLVWFSHTVHHTTISAFISILAMYYITKVKDAPNKISNYILTGICLGVGIGIKLYPVLFSISLIIIHFQNNPILLNRKLSFKKFYLLAIAGLTTIMVGSLSYPWYFLEFKLWNESIAYSNVYFTGGNPFANLFYVIWGQSEYFQTTCAEPFSFWNNSLRIISETMLVSILCSVFFIFYKNRKVALLLLTPAIVFLLHHCLRGGLAMGARQFYFLLPTLYIVFGFFIAHILDLIESYSFKNSLIIKVLCVSALFIQPILWIGKYLFLLRNPSTIETGRNWISNELQSGDILFVNYAAPFANQSNWFRTNAETTLVQNARQKILPSFEVVSLEEKSYDSEIKVYKGKYKNLYVALTDYNSTAYYYHENAKLWGEHKYFKFASKMAFFHAIKINSVELKSIVPKSNNQMGPSIRIYRINE